MLGKFIRQEIRAQGKVMLLILGAMAAAEIFMMILMLFERHVRTLICGGMRYLRPDDYIIGGDCLRVPVLPLPSVDVLAAGISDTYASAENHADSACEDFCIVCVPFGHRGI